MGVVFMENHFLFLIYIVFVCILGILSIVLKKKHTQFPDFSVGYHNKKIMKSKEIWNYANNVAGNLCALSSVVGIVISAIIYILKVNISAALIIFFIYSLTTILLILILPVQLSKKYFRSL